MECNLAQEQRIHQLLPGQMVFVRSAKRSLTGVDHLLFLFVWHL
jgi:hypothetical protein